MSPMISLNLQDFMRASTMDYKVLQFGTGLILTGHPYPEEMRGHSISAYQGDVTFVAFNDIS
jgi:hypothetical protein